METVLMDLSKVYYCHPHTLLTVKLVTYDFQDSTTSLISDYISERYQQVKIGWAFSSYLEILRGVPQGLVLLILFNMLINDLVFFIQEAEVCNDTTLYSCSLNYKDAADKLSNDSYIFLNLV